MKDNLPQVIFKYAYPLDRNRRQLFEEKNFGDYPSQERVEEEVESWRELWSEINKDGYVIKQIVDLIGIDYPRDIEAFVIGDGLGAMSTPLILPVASIDGAGNDKRIELIIHEILHLFVGDREAVPEAINYWKMVREKWVDESILTQNHIIIYALLTVMLNDLIPDVDVKDLIHEEATNYHRALEIAREEGVDQIIEEFHSFARAE